MGSLFHIPVVKTDIIKYLSDFKKNGTVIGGFLDGTDEFIAGNNTCIVVGNEARGISDDVSALCEHRYKIPIYGRAESLNAGVAAGLMLYRAAEYTRSMSNEG